MKPQFLTHNYYHCYFQHYHKVYYHKVQKWLVFLPVDLVQERCLVMFSLTSLTPRALQVHSTDGLSQNLKNTRWHLCGRWRFDAQVSDKNTQKLKEIYSAEPY